MRAQKPTLGAWFEDIPKEYSPTCFHLAPWNCGDNVSYDPIAFVKWLQTTSKLCHDSAASSDPRVGPHERKRASARMTVSLVLCHSNAILSRFEKHGIPGKYGITETYKNSFLETFRSKADLSTCDFDPDDSKVFCMTYGQCAKLLCQIHVNVTMRSTRGEHVEKAVLSLATHILMLDSWYSTCDLFAVYHVHAALAAYGCAMPRICHLSQSVALRSGASLMKSYYAAPQRTLKINLHGSIPVADGKTILARQVMHNIHVKFGDLMDRLSAENMTGTSYIVVPDVQCENELRKMYQHKLSRVGWYFESTRSEESDKIWKFVHMDELTNTAFVRPEYLIILPITKTHAGYVIAEKKTIAGAIGMLGTFVKRDTTAASYVPIDVYVLGPDFTFYSREIDVIEFIGTAPVDPYESSKKYMIGASENDKLRYLCMFAGSSVQPGEVFDSSDALSRATSTFQTASDRNLIRFTSHNFKAVVTHVQPMGMVMMQVGVSPLVAAFLERWRTVPYRMFPGFCVAALLERYVDRKAPLVSGTIEELAAIAKEFDFRDPFVHQLTVIVEYIKQYGIVLVDIGQIRDLCETYGADPEILRSIIARVCAFRAGLANDSKYGPFDPDQMVSILNDNDIFTTVGYVPSGLSQETGAIFVDANETKRFAIIGESPYEIPKTLLAMYYASEDTSAYERKKYSLKLYAVTN